MPPYTGRSGPAWEGDGPFVQRYIDTVKAALTDPRTFFATMRLSGGLAAPVTFALVGMAIGALAGAVWSSFGSFGSFGSLGDFPGGGAGGGFLGVLVFGAAAGIAGLFIGSGIFHVMLSLLGAARQPFEATFRVVAYAGGSTALIGIIPFCGSVLGALYGIYLYIVGLSAVHECDNAKAAIAVVTPAVVCCVLFMLFWGAVMALIFGAAAAGAAMQ
jgi:hypothetical protein